MKYRPILVCLSLMGGACALAQAPPAGGPPSPEIAAARAAVGKACDADTKASCPGKQGHEAMMCLQAVPAEKVSTGCKDAMGKLVTLMTPKK
ncbi:MAG: hypothetical protein ABI616_14955 [Pseudomonadota bacterium]